MKVLELVQASQEPRLHFDLPNLPHVDSEERKDDGDQDTISESGSSAQNSLSNPINIPEQFAAAKRAARQRNRSRTNSTQQITISAEKRTIATQTISAPSGAYEVSSDHGLHPGSHDEFLEFQR